MSSNRHCSPSRGVKIESLEGRVLLSAAPADPWSDGVFASLAAPRAAIAQALAAPDGSRVAVRRASRARVSNILSVSSDGRYLVHSDGSPFFYLADTAWSLMDRLSRSQVSSYLTARAKQGFSVIQIEINTRFGGTRYGDRAFINNNPARPNEAYFKYLDYVINTANSLGMYISLVPLDTRWAANGIFTRANVFGLGQFLGRRYGTSKIIWTLGGDIGGNEAAGGVPMWRNLAAGITDGVGGASRALLQYHPAYNQSSSTWFHNDAWLDANAIQSGHNLNGNNYSLIAADYGRSPAKPVMDAEASYEDMPAGIKAGNPRLMAQDVRKSAYWALFAGAHGVTYGNNNVWQFVNEPNSRNLGTMNWTKALGSPGAASMSVLRRLMLSRPYLNRVPDQSLIAGSALGGGDHLQATRGADGSYAFIYTASGRDVTVNLQKLSGSTITARWYNPRKGKSGVIGTFSKTGVRNFVPPTRGDDWVLVLDDASKHYGKP